MSTNKNSLDAVLQDRTVIPHWKTPSEAIETSSSDGLKLSKRLAASSPWLQHLKATYEQFPSASSANELFELATMYGHKPDLLPTVAPIAQTLRAKANLPIVNLLKSDSPSVLQEKNIDESVDIHLNIAKSSIHVLRKQLAENPNRPFCWSELSRNYLVIAEPEKAIKSMQVALNLSSHNRYLQRVATRLYVHLGDPERALRLLRLEPSVTRDPWLLAAEIATSTNAKRQSKFLNAAKNMISTEHFNVFQLSELTAAMGTIEISHGATKKAKILFNQSLKAPTQNSLAQAQWAVEKDSKIIIPDSAWQIPASYEAEALAARHAGEWDKAIRACIKWLADEPYSISAALMGSYFGFWQSHHYTAEQFANVGLRSFTTNSDNTNISLLNNRAVARAFQGKVEEAFSDFLVAMDITDGKHNAHLIATLGLIAFRAGMPDAGRDLYKQSIAWFSQTKDQESSTRAILYLMREEVRIDKSAIQKAVDFAKKIIGSSLATNLPELDTLSQLIIEESQTLRESFISGDSKNLPFNKEILTQQASRFAIPSQALKLLSKTQDYIALVKI